MELSELPLMLPAVFRQIPEEISQALIIRLIISKHLGQFLDPSPALVLRHGRPQSIRDVFGSERAVVFVPLHLDADLLLHKKPGVEALIEHQRQQHHPDAPREALGDGVPAGVGQKPTNRFMGQQPGLRHPAAADQSPAIDTLLEAFRQPACALSGFGVAVGWRPERPDEWQAGRLQTQRDCLELRACQLRLAAEGRVHDGSPSLSVQPPQSRLVAGDVLCRRRREQADRDHRLLVELVKHLQPLRLKLRSAPDAYDLALSDGHGEPVAFRHAGVVRNQAVEQLARLEDAVRDGGRERHVVRHHGEVLRLRPGVLAASHEPLGGAIETERRGAEQAQERARHAVPRRGRGRPVRGVVDDHPVGPLRPRLLQDGREFVGKGGVVGYAEVRAEVVGREVDARLGVLRQALHARQCDVHDADLPREFWRDAD